MNTEKTTPVTAIVLGASGRGKLYGDYSQEHPEDLQITGIAELVELRRNIYGDKYHVPEENRVATWEEMLSRPKFADAVIIATPDHLHYAPCMKALDLGYDILLEKPIAQTDEECRRLVAYAKEKGKIVGLTHVLRYSPYFGMLKEMVSSKAIGDLVSIQHFEPIEHVHMSHSYVRGSWRNAEASTPLVLAKSSHDLDILHWIIGKPCKKVVAFGDLAHFKAENAPEDAPARCTDGCPAIIRKTKCFDFWERNVLFPKTKRSFFRTPTPLPCPFPLNFSLLIITKKFGNFAKNRYICIV